MIQNHNTQNHTIRRTTQYTGPHNTQQHTHTHTHSRNITIASQNYLPLTPNYTHTHTQHQTHSQNKNLPFLPVKSIPIASLSFPFPFPPPTMFPQIKFHAERPPQKTHARAMPPEANERGERETEKKTHTTRRSSYAIPNTFRLDLETFLWPLFPNMLTPFPPRRTVFNYPPSRHRQRLYTRRPSTVETERD
jgi:hypothetical protein